MMQKKKNRFVISFSECETGVMVMINIGEVTSVDKVFKLKNDGALVEPPGLKARESDAQRQ
jgi:hypothetical protein